FWTARGMTPAERMQTVAGLDNGVQSRFEVGEEGRAWLKRDLEKVDHQTPLVVFSHSPLYKYYRPWNFWTEDAEEVQAILKPFPHVTVIHGHTHQLLTNRIDNIQFHGMLSTAWPWPYAPEGLPKLTIQMNRADPFDQFDGCGDGAVEVLESGLVNKLYNLWDRNPVAVRASYLTSGGAVAERRRGGRPVRREDDDRDPRRAGGRHAHARAGARRRHRAHGRVAAHEPRCALGRGARTPCRRGRAEGERAARRGATRGRHPGGADLRRLLGARRAHLAGGDGEVRAGGPPRLPRREGVRRYDRRLLRHVPPRRRQHAPGDVSQVPGAARAGRPPARHDQLVHPEPDARQAARRRRPAAQSDGGLHHRATQGGRARVREALSGGGPVQARQEQGELALRAVRIAALIVFVSVAVFSPIDVHYSPAGPRPVLVVYGAHATLGLAILL